MSTQRAHFFEAPVLPPGNMAVSDTPLRNLGLGIQGTLLEPVIEQIRAELACTLKRLKPRFYLSTEWGVPFGSVSVGIPFYLAKPELLRLHAERVGHIEGGSRTDLLRYLRHELGHVVNYGYKLYEDEEWISLFGPITRPYVEDYRPKPFSRRFVRHLPGWYAQKHPDEDFAETFAVWLTPGLDWRSEYAKWPRALMKLNYVDAVVRRLVDVPPVVTTEDLDEDVAEITLSPEQYYRNCLNSTSEEPPTLDSAMRSIFEDLGSTTGVNEKASELFHRMENTLMADVYRWTGHFPERTRMLLRHLAERADLLNLSYAEDRESEAVVSLTTFLTALAMNYVHEGGYTP